jgi:hypothetical protein
LSYGNNMAGVFLMMRWERRAASIIQERRTAEWKTCQTMPFSANFDTRLSGCFTVGLRCPADGLIL